jgi:hypothetical protein
MLGLVMCACGHLQNVRMLIRLLVTTVGALVLQFSRGKLWLLAFLAVYHQFASSTCLSTVSM